VVAAADDAAVGQRRGRVRHDAPLDQVAHVVERVEAGLDFGQMRAGAGGQAPLERGQGVGRLLEPHHVARVGAAVGDLGGDALDVVDVSQDGPQLAAQERLGDQLGHGLLPPADARDVAERIEHHLAEQAPAHRGHRGVEHAQQRGVGPPRAQGLHQLEAGLGGLVEDQVVAAEEMLEPREVAQAAALGFGQVVQHGAGGAQPGLEALATEALERGHAEVLEQRLAPACGVEGPVGPRRPVRVEQRAQGLEHAVLGAVLAVGEEALGGAHAAQLVEQLPRLDLLDQEPPRREVHPRQAALLAQGRDGGEEVVRLGVEQRLLGEGAGRDHARHVAVHHALGLAGVLNLVAHGHLVAGHDEALEVGVNRVVGKARQRHRALAVGARGERQAAHARQRLRVLEERLIEIAHAEEQHRSRVLFLEAGVLPHGRGRGLGQVVVREELLRLGHRLPRLSAPSILGWACVESNPAGLRSARPARGAGPDGPPAPLGSRGGQVSA